MATRNRDFTTLEEEFFLKGEDLSKDSHDDGLSHDDGIPEDDEPTLDLQLTHSTFWHVPPGE